MLGDDFSLMLRRACILAFYHDFDVEIELTCIPPIMSRVGRLAGSMLFRNSGSAEQRFLRVAPLCN
jgi:hypothetical protein